MLCSLTRCTHWSHTQVFGKERTICLSRSILLKGDKHLQGCSCRSTALVKYGSKDIRPEFSEPDLRLSTISISALTWPVSEHLLKAMDVIISGSCHHLQGFALSWVSQSLRELVSPYIPFLSVTFTAFPVAINWMLVIQNKGAD